MQGNGNFALGPTGGVAPGSQCSHSRAHRCSIQALPHVNYFTNPDEYVRKVNQKVDLNTRYLQGAPTNSGLL